jgi:hypothetical protein
VLKVALNTITLTLHMFKEKWNHYLHWALTSQQQLNFFLSHCQTCIIVVKLKLYHIMLYRISKVTSVHLSNILKRLIYKQIF